MLNAHDHLWATSLSLSGVWEIQLISISSLELQETGEEGGSLNPLCCLCNTAIYFLLLIAYGGVSWTELVSSDSNQGIR